MSLVKLAGCTGCGLCETACSHHHSGAFQPSVSSIIVHRDNEGFYADIVTEDAGGRFGCDLCEGLDIEQCVKYCNHAKQSLRAVIDEIREMKRSGGAERK